jgi:hypothetical protein
MMRDQQNPRPAANDTACMRARPMRAGAILAMVASLAATGAQAQSVVSTAGGKVRGAGREAAEAFLGIP